MSAERERMGIFSRRGQLSMDASFGGGFLFLALCSLFDARGLSLPTLGTSAGLLLVLGGLGLFRVVKKAQVDC